MSAPDKPEPSKLSSLPDELFVKIFRLVRSDCFPSREKVEYIDTDGREPTGVDIGVFPATIPINSPSLDPDLGPSPLQDLYNLCLVSRRWSGPATQVLYENVELGHHSLRAFLQTIITSPPHAVLTQQIWCRHISHYSPLPSHYNAPVDSERRIISLAERHGVSDQLKTLLRGSRLVPLAHIEQLLVALSLPQIQVLHADVPYHHQENIHGVWRDLSEVACLVDIVKLYNFQSHKVFRTLTGLHLSVPPKAIKIDHTVSSFDGIAPLLALGTIKDLSLTRFASGNLDFSKALAEAGVKTIRLQTLCLNDCTIDHADLHSLVSIIGGLESFRLRRTYASDPFWWNSMRKAFSQLESCANTLKHIDLDAVFRYHASRFTPNRSHAKELAHYTDLLSDRFDFSRFSALRSLSISSPFLTGPPTGDGEASFSGQALPPGLQELYIHFPTNVYAPLSTNEPELVEAVYVNLARSVCEAAIRANTVILSLKKVQLHIHWDEHGPGEWSGNSGWPTLPAEAIATLASAVSDTQTGRIMIYGNYGRNSKRDLLSDKGQETPLRAKQ